jgi:hypothetical protein
VTLVVLAACWVLRRKANRAWSIGPATWRARSAAPAGGVMLSESTARLVEHIVVLAEPD